MKKKIGIVILATMMATLVACGNDSKTGSNETSTVAVNNETENNTQENNTQENTTEEKQEANNSELTDEYLLSLPESSTELFDYSEFDDGSGIYIDQYIGEDDENAIIVVPSSIDGKPVKEISLKAFYNVTLKAVVVGGDVEYLDENAFLMSTIDKVLITSPIKETGNGVFQQSRIKELVLTNTEVIGCTCFSSSTIDLIRISDKTKTIKDGAFITTKTQKLIIEGDCVSEGAFLGNKIQIIEFTSGNFTFDESDKTKFEETKFIAPAGSNVEQFAKDNGINFEALD